MRISNLGVLAAISGAALLAGAGVARAQGPVQVIPVAPGISLVVSQSAAPAPMPVLASSFAALQQAELALAEANMSLAQAALQPVDMPAMPPGAQAVTVVSFSDGTHSCTQRIIYPANGGAPQVQLTSAGGECQAPAFRDKLRPMAEPLPSAALPPRHTAPPRLILADAATAAPG